MSGTADNGTTFGAAIDLDENAAGVNQDDAGVAIFISGDLGTLTLGDTDGALDWAMQEVDFNGAASINDDHTTHAGFNGNGGLDGHYDGQILRYDYSFGDFSVALSVEQDDNTTAMGDALRRRPRCAGRSVDGDPVWGIGAKYSGMFAGGTFGIGIGYQFTNDGDQTAAATVGASRDRYLRKRRARLRLLGSDQLLDAGHRPGERRRHALGYWRELHVRRDHRARQLR
jgi:outer membrane protein OmpU